MHSISATNERPAPAVLEIRDLEVRYPPAGGEIVAVAGFSLALAPGECIGVVGESGAGKSQAFLALMGLLGERARVRGSARFEGTELIGAPRAVLDRLRGDRLAMIFQDPMTSLTPHLHIGRQIGESLRRHRGASRSEARAAALRLLRQVRMPDAERCLDRYPHELSGGMRQRAMIAMALACGPRLLIADEPTTALDVTVQAQILALLAALKREHGMSMVLISHDFGVIAGLAERVAVMYAGRMVELGSARAVLKAPRHPYTQALLRSVPRLDTPEGTPREAIAGQPPNPLTLPAGCAFEPRCAHASARCRLERPALEVRAEREVACHHPGSEAA